MKLVCNTPKKLLTPTFDNARAELPEKSLRTKCYLKDEFFSTTEPPEVATVLSLLKINAHQHVAGHVAVHLLTCIKSVC